MRSGVLTSVHAFATDPTRGYFILGFLGVVVGGSLLLYALRAPQLKNAPSFNWASRETFLLLNNIIFVLATWFVMFGTLYPIIVEFFWDSKISVGPPWFDLFFSPMMIAIGLLMGVGIFLNWKKTQFKKIQRWLVIPLVAAVIAAVIFPQFGDSNKLGTAITAFVGAWVVCASISEILRKTRHSNNRLQAMRKLGLSFWGMTTAHLGFAMCFMGCALNTFYSDQQDLRMEYGQRVDVGGFEFVLEEVAPVSGPNYKAERGLVKVYKDEDLRVELHPEKRRYLSGGNVMTEASIDPGFFRDLYVALGEELDSRAWSVRVHYKPFVRWIWLGALLMAFGGIMAIVDKRYRLKRSVEQEQGSKATPSGGASESDEGETQTA